MRHDKPSLQLAPNDETMEETSTPHTAGTWEQHIINHLISYFNVGDLEPIEVTSSSDWEGSDEDEPVPVAKVKGKGKQKERKDPGNTLALQWYCQLMLLQWIHASVLTALGRKKPLVTLTVGLMRICVLPHN